MSEEQGQQRCLMVVSPGPMLKRTRIAWSAVLARLAVAVPTTRLGFSCDLCGVEAPSYEWDDEPPLDWEWQHIDALGWSLVPMVGHNDLTAIACTECTNAYKALMARLEIGVQSQRRPLEFKEKG